MNDYDLRPIRLPRLAGPALRAVAAIAGNPVGLALLGPTLRKNAGLPVLRSADLSETPMTRPDRALMPTRAGDTDRSADVVVEGDGGGHFPGVGSYAKAYRDGSASPVDVADRFLLERERLDKEADHRAMITVDPASVRAQARASAERLRAGTARSFWEGVPVAIKDELDVAGLPTRVGTTFLGRSPSTRDAEVVRRLRDAGAILVGKAAMHEIGLGVTGLNPHHGTPKNPFDPSRHTGGSSSGSASVVGAGLVPLAVGADGGGSIRVPASLCGAVGLKATWGRISEQGAYPLCWTVGHVGPIGHRVRDVAAAYLLLAGEVQADETTHGQPAPQISHAFDGDVRGLRIGVFDAWNGDAEEDVATACRLAIERLVARGATVVPCSIPHLDLARVAHAVTITTEMLCGLAGELPAHGGELAPDIRLNLAIASTFSARDFVQAQRVRARLTRSFAAVFGECDVIVTPTTGRTAPPIHADALDGGESDLGTLSALMRFVFPGNLTGWPALTVPVGVDRQGLPMGLQIHGRPWDESLLLHVGEAVERDHPSVAPKLAARVLGA